MVWEEKIFKGFLLWLPWQPEFFMNTIIWINLKKDHLRNIPVKFCKNPVISFWGEVFFEGRVYGRTHTWTNGWTNGHTTDTKPVELKTVLFVTIVKDRKVSPLQFKPLPHNTTFWCTNDIKLWKTWVNEKLLVTNNFSFLTMFSTLYGTYFSF